MNKSVKIVTLKHRAFLLILVCAFVVPSAVLAQDKGTTQSTTRSVMQKSKKEVKGASADLAIDKITEKNPTLFVVTIKNLGTADAAATALRVTYTVGVFPKGSSFPVPAIKAGSTTDVNCQMEQPVAKGTNCQFDVNVSKTVAETNYTNNSKAFASTL